MTATVAISPQPKLQFNQGGLPLAGGLLFTYAAGTTNKLATYTDSTGATPNANPIVLNANGEANVYLTAGVLYKFTLSPATDTDPPANAYWSVDNLYCNVASAIPYADAGGTADAITATYVVTSPVLVDGYLLIVDIATTNATTTPTFAPTLNGVLQTATTIVKSVGNVNVALDAGDLQGNAELIYDLQNLVWVLQNPAVANATVANVSRAYTTGGTSTAYTLTPTPAITAYAANQTYDVIFNQACGASPTITISGIATPPNLVVQNADGSFSNVTSGAIPANWQSTVTLISPTQALVLRLFATQVAGDNTNYPSTDQFVQTAVATAFRSYLSGLTMSAAGGSTTMSIAAGTAIDSTNAVAMSIGACTKTTASWAVGSGNGGLDTGAIASSTWYYFYVICRPDTGVVDLIFSLSASAPTLPANYTQYRYIGAGRTDGSSNWVAFKQMGREFYWSTPVADFNGTGSSTAALLTLTIPSGRKMKVYMAGSMQTGDFCYISDPSNADLATSTSASPLSTFSSVPSQGMVWSNASAQIRHRESAAASTILLTLGWLDLADSTI